MSRNVPSPMRAALATRATTMCMCWKVSRRDGTILGFTDHDKPLAFDSVTFQASTSFTASAIEDQLGLAVSNTEVIGALSSDAIINDDLLSTRYDDATVEVYVVNWQDVTQRVSVLRGTLGQVQIGDLAFQAELRSLGQHFAQYVGTLCQPKCQARAKFGLGGSGLEAGCHATLPAPVAGTVSAVTDRKTFSVTASGSFPAGGGGSLAGGFFDYGTVTFTSGKNIGIGKEIFSSDATVALTVREPFPQEIMIGDTVTLQIGCDGLLETCAKNYDQVDNYRGQPYVPGTDAVFKVNSEGN